MQRTVLAPAKVNLILDVLGKRPDGYHDVAMLMVRLSLHDRVTVALVPGWNDHRGLPRPRTGRRRGEYRRAGGAAVSRAHRGRGPGWTSHRQADPGGGRPWRRFVGRRRGSAGARRTARHSACRATNCKAWACASAPMCRSSCAGRRLPGPPASARSRAMARDCPPAVWCWSTRASPSPRPGSIKIWG